MEHNGSLLLLVGFKAMATHLKEHAGMTIHPDTLRKAVRDKRNPLKVTWDGFSATITSSALMAWREGRRGLRRQATRKAS